MSQQSPKQRGGGFAYHVADAQILRWQSLPPAVKLQWLEDANRLLWLALSPQAKAIRERFHRGELQPSKETCKRTGGSSCCGASLVVRRPESRPLCHGLLELGQVVPLPPHRAERAGGGLLVWS